jgi:hypothetical protein
MVRMDIVRCQNPAGQNVIRVTFEIEEPRVGCFLDWEDALAGKISELTRRTTAEALCSLDTDGLPVLLNGIKWTSKGKEKRMVETLGGSHEIFRHVYQTSLGGATRVPVDERAGLISGSTPHFAKIVAAKSAEMSAALVTRDMLISHKRTMAPSFVQDLACAVSQRALGSDPDMAWEPLIKKSERQQNEKEKVSHIVLGMDSASVCTTRPHPTAPKKRELQWRMAHCMTIAFYNNEGKRLETLFVGSGPGEQAPEGKAVFFAQAERWVKRVKDAFPGVLTLGLSDAASDLEAWIGERVDHQGIDFYHAGEYLTKAAPGLLNASWAEESHGHAHILAGALRVQLRDELDGAQAVLGLMVDHIESHGDRLTQAHQEGLKEAITYFTNHQHLMNYAGWSEKKWPIGSGVTEAACKVIIKQRLSKSGMRWSVGTTHSILTLRALYRSPSRWEAFWAHYSKETKNNAM